MNPSNKLLVSACLLGEPVRYDGQSKPLAELQWLVDLKAQGRLFVICPEMAGGLPVPRPKAEQSNDRVITIFGDDVTNAFSKGANKAVSICQQNQIGFALLKAKSPSCGNEQIYDGTFSGNLIEGMGVTAQKLHDHGVAVYSELQLAHLQRHFDAC